MCDAFTFIFIFVELPYAPIITGIALNTESNRAVDVRFIAGFDGNSPVTKFIVEYRLASESKFTVFTALRKSFTLSFEENRIQNLN